MTPDEREYLKQNRQKAKRGTKNGGRLPSAKRQETGPDRQRKCSVLDQSWGPVYQGSEHWKDIWNQTHTGAQEWPKGFQIQRDKLYYMGKLCVPETFTTGILAEFHVASGHVGVERMLKEMAHRFIFAPGEPITAITKEVRRGCAVCQACDHPTWKAKGPIGCNPVPERLMASVCLDVFDLPEQQWKGEDYDALLLCVDRLSGWFVAYPTTKLGLTAEKAAHMMLEHGWEPFGIPSTITSDRGAQFIGQWWRTMCAHLGVKQSYRQAYRPQANGRAERAGQQIITLLRKLTVEEGINWVETYPEP